EVLVDNIHRNRYNFCCIICLSQFNYTAFAGSAEPAISFTEKKGLLEMNLFVHFATAPFLILYATT
ncbi:hypothetical protein, partial [Hydrogenispora ethanolica]|uniref:hypothetical protein n=1 Tax=Hydrogenispora ethanolica TaxID=1082276 RepID=UPI001A9E332D